METDLERYIREFVWEKAQERVQLHLTPELHLRHVTRRGATLLAAFWANLLQHYRNYPTDKYRYRKVVERHGAGRERLVVRVPEEHVTLSVVMETGTLVIQGESVFAWFKHRFTHLLDNYDPEFRLQRHRQQERPSSSSCRLQLQRRGGRSLQDPASRYSVRDREIERRVQHHADEYRALMDRGGEDYIPGLEHLALYEEEFSYLSPEELDVTLRAMETGGLHDAYTCVYKAWRSLLRRWFETDATQIYVATPRLDAQRLRDVVDCFIGGKLRDNLAGIFLQHRRDGGKTVGEMKKSVVDSHKDNTGLQIAIEHYIYRKIFQLKEGEIEARFIAGVSEVTGMAEVLVTCADFTGSSFRAGNAVSAQFLTMAAVTFERNYLAAIESLEKVTML